MWKLRHQIAKWSSLHFVCIFCIVSTFWILTQIWKILFLHLDFGFTLLCICLRIPILFRNSCIFIVFAQPLQSPLFCIWRCTIFLYKFCNFGITYIYIQLCVKVRVYVSVCIWWPLKRTANSGRDDTWWMVVMNGRYDESPWCRKTLTLL